MAIYFYVPNQEYGALSNFSRHGVSMGGAWWSTVEHFFQAQKFEDEPLRADRDEVKEEVMLAACRQKFATHQEARDVLLSTGEEEIIENAPNDAFWGCGPDGQGRNALAAS